MAFRGEALTLSYLAWNTSTNTPQTGDEGNHTLRIIKDGVESTPAGSPSEIDATNLRGVYSITLTANEMQADALTFGGISGTANVEIIPIIIITQRRATGFTM